MQVIELKNITIKFNMNNMLKREHNKKTQIKKKVSKRHRSTAAQFKNHLLSNPENMEMKVTFKLLKIEP